MGVLRQLAGQTVVYGVSTILGRMLNYLLVPIYTSVLSAGSYGIVTEFYAYVAFLNVIYTYGMETAYFRYANRPDYGPTATYNETETSVLLSSLLFSGLLAFFSEEIAILLGYPNSGLFIIWFAGILAIDAIVAIPFARLRLEKRARSFATYKLVGIVLNIGLNLFFLVFCPFWLNHFPTGAMADFIRSFYDPEIGIGYIFLSNLIANSIFLVFFYKYLLKTRLWISRKWKPVFIYAMPLTLMGLAGVTNEMLSRAMLKYWLPEGYYPDRTNLEALGIFGACYKLSIFMTLAVQAFRYAFEPFFFSNEKSEGSVKMLSTVMHYFIIFGSFIWLIVCLLLDDIAPIFLRRPIYLEGLEVVPWLLGGGLLLGIYFNLSVWYKLTDKTSYGAYISLAGAILTIVFNILLIPVLGYLGSAIATVVTYLGMVLLSYFLGRSHYPIPYSTGKGVFYLLFTAFLIMGFNYLELSDGIRYTMMGGCLVFYIFVAWLVDFRKGFKRTIAQ